MTSRMPQKQVHELNVVRMSVKVQQLQRAQSFGVEGVASTPETRVPHPIEDAPSGQKGPPLVDLLDLGGPAFAFIMWSGLLC